MQSVEYSLELTGFPFLEIAPFELKMDKTC